MSAETGYIAAGIIVSGLIVFTLSKLMKKNANRNDPDPAFWPERMSNEGESEKSRSRRSNSLSRSRLSSRSRSKSGDSDKSEKSVIGSEKGEKGEARGGRRKRTMRRR